MSLSNFSRFVPRSLSLFPSLSVLNSSSFSLLRPSFSSPSASSSLASPSLSALNFVPSANFAIVSRDTLDLLQETRDVIAKIHNRLILDPKKLAEIEKKDADGTINDAELQLLVRHHYALLYDVTDAELEKLRTTDFYALTPAEQEKFKPMIESIEDESRFRQVLKYQAEMRVQPIVYNYDGAPKGYKNSLWGKNLNFESIEENGLGIPLRFLPGPFGTQEDPVVVYTEHDSRMVGCTGGRNFEHEALFFILKKGKKHVCIECGQFFKLQTTPDDSPIKLPDEWKKTHDFIYNAGKNE